MILNPADVLNPVFNALDALISDYGVYCYLVFVWLSVAVIAWVLSGGLRRKRSSGCAPHCTRRPAPGVLRLGFREREDFHASLIIWN